MRMSLIINVFRGDSVANCPQSCPNFGLHAPAVLVPSFLCLRTTTAGSRR